jgi:hypothetical protein
VPQAKNSHCRRYTSFNRYSNSFVIVKGSTHHNVSLKPSVLTPNVPTYPVWYNEGKIEECREQRSVYHISLSGPSDSTSKTAGDIQRRKNPTTTGPLFFKQSFVNGTRPLSPSASPKCSSWSNTLSTKTTPKQPLLQLCRAVHDVLIAKPAASTTPKRKGASWPRMTQRSKNAWPS